MREAGQSTSSLRSTINDSVRWQSVISVCAYRFRWTVRADSTHPHLTQHNNNHFNKVLHVNGDIIGCVQTRASASFMSHSWQTQPAITTHTHNKYHCTVILIKLFEVRFVLLCSDICYNKQFLNCTAVEWVLHSTADVRHQHRCTHKHTHRRTLSHTNTSFHLKYINKHE